MARLVQMRDSTKMALERGTLDKFGKSHDDEQRAVLYVLNQLLSYVPSLETSLQALQERMKQDEATAGKTIYGADVIGAYDPFEE